MLLFRVLTLAATAASLSFAQPVTYSEHIAPIIYANCSNCHRPGQVAPFTFLSYSDVKAKGALVASVTQSRYMPPWKPEPGWVAYRDERRLTPQQIALIQQWVDEGMPEGDPSQAPPAPAFTSGWQLGTPDLVLEMPVGFSVPADGPDIYRNFVLPTNLTEDKWVRAIEFSPSARPVVHHSLFFSDTTGAARAQDALDGQPGFPGFGSIFTLGNPLAAISGGLGGWVPGTTPAFLPEGLAYPLPAGSDLLLQTHFHPNGAGQVEKTRVALYFGPAPTRQITQVQVPAFFGVRANIDIPAGENQYRVRDSHVLAADVDAIGVAAHAHYLAKEAKLTATLPTGEVRILLWIRDWDFNWQDQYQFQNFVSLPKGTRLDGELVYDNSENNFRNPNSPPKRVKWGENSTDEMGSLILTVAPKDAADIDLLRGDTLIYVLLPVPLVGNKPLAVSSGVRDAASQQPGAVTPGKLLVLYGNRLGPSQLVQTGVDSGGHVATTLSGTQVLFDGQPAPLLYTSAGQVAAIAPYALDGRNGTQVQIRNGNLISDLIALPVKAVAPSIFSADETGTGPAAIVNEDGTTLNSFTTPAAKGSLITIYATGEGQTAPAGNDGLVIAGDNPPQPVLPVKVTIDGRPADVQLASEASGNVSGLLRIQARVPLDASSGIVPIQISVGDVASQPGVTVSVK